MKANGLLLMVSVFLSTVMVNFATDKGDAKTDKDDVSTWSLKKKTSMAVRYRSAKHKKASAQLSKIETAKLSPKQLTDETMKYTAIITKYVNLTNSLKLPCTSNPKVKNNKGYRDWLRNFQKNDKAIQDSLSARYQKIIAQKIKELKEQ